MAKKRNRFKITKGERLLYVGGFLSFILAIMIQIFCGASIGNLKMNVEKLNYEITGQNKTNESLNMKVNELTAFDKVKDVVKDMGLAYNNDNIVVIDN